MDFWSPDVWLPTAINSKARIQWSDLEDFAAKGNQISRARDLYAVPFYAVLMLIARFIFEKTFGEWSASFFNIKVGFSKCVSGKITIFQNAKKITPEKNQILEDFYKKNKKPTDTDVKQLSFDLGSDKWNERKIQRWFRHRRNLKLVKIITLLIR